MENADHEECDATGLLEGVQGAMLKGDPMIVPQVCAQGPLGFCKAEGRPSHFNLWLKRALDYYVIIKGREFWKTLRAHQARMVSET